MTVKDYYKILGLERTASAEDIRSAYLRLSKKFHPDLNPDDEQSLRHFLEVNEAYRVLGNLDNRLQYSIKLNKRIKLPKEVDKITSVNGKKK